MSGAGREGAERCFAAFFLPFDGQLGLHRRSKVAASLPASPSFWAGDLRGSSSEAFSFAGALSHQISTSVPAQASRRACVTSSSASGTTSPSLPPLRTGMCSCGTSAGRTATRGCSRPTTGLSSAATGTQRTGGCGAGPCRLPGLSRDERAPENGIGTFWWGKSRDSDPVAPCVRDWAIAGGWEQLLR